MARPERVRALTLVWLREKQFNAGTEFAVVEKPAEPTDVDFGTADLWLRQKKAVAVEARPGAAKK